MEVKSFKTLEFNKIIDKLQNYAGSELGKKIAGQLTPYTDIDEIKLLVWVDLEILAHI